MSDGQGPDQLHDPNHSFDGIQEYDNNLPMWWQVSLYLCIIGSVIYGVWIHFGPGEVGTEAWATAERKAQEELLAQGGPLTEDVLRGFLNDTARVEAGKQLWVERNCAQCHLASGLGSVGPNLRDDYWRWGSNMVDIVETLEKGRNGGQMPPQGLSRDQLINMSVFLVDWNVNSKANGQGVPLTDADVESRIDYHNP